jgi:integrase
VAEAVRLTAAVTRYLERREKQTAAGTFVNDRSLILRFQAYVGGNPYMRSITPDQVFDFFYAGDENGLNPKLAESTFNVARGRLGHFLSYCEKRTWTDPLLMDEIRTKAEPEKEQRRFTATELVQFCASPTQPQEKILVALAANTALRINDITSLRMSVLNSQGELDHETPTVDLANGWIHTRISKSRKQDSLPITLELDAALREWLTHYGETLGRPLEPDMLLVPAKVNVGWGGGTDRAVRYNPYDKISSPDSKYRRLVREAGLPFTKGNGFHTLRRSFARIFYEELKVQAHPDPIRPVQAMLHHAKPEMTYHYIGVQLDREARNEVLRGMSFLSRLAADTSNVTQLRSVDGTS